VLNNTMMIHMQLLTFLNHWFQKLLEGLSGFVLCFVFCVFQLFAVVCVFVVMMLSVVGWLNCLVV